MLPSIPAASRAVFCARISGGRTGCPGPGVSAPGSSVSGRAARCPRCRGASVTGCSVRSLPVAVVVRNQRAASLCHRWRAENREALGGVVERWCSCSTVVLCGAQQIRPSAPQQRRSELRPLLLSWAIAPVLASLSVSQLL